MTRFFSTKLAKIDSSNYAYSGETFIVNPHEGAGAIATMNESHGLMKNYAYSGETFIVNPHEGAGLFATMNENHDLT